MSICNEMEFTNNKPFIQQILLNIIKNKSCGFQCITILDRDSVLCCPLANKKVVIVDAQRTSAEFPNVDVSTKTSYYCSVQTEQARYKFAIQKYIEKYGEDDLFCEVL